jgi:hypothetical protein
MASSLEGHALSWPIPVADVTEHVPPNTTFQHSSQVIGKPTAWGDREQTKE